ncbi:unnamed protein product [Rotaria sordida]|uniref:Dynamin N-terminal domain-containing protein n=1 Tax=Rotaria sordida TaxID=392033 RepID=A0A819IAD5_9BILA|nr:unnamed protein product [Rotaria sordida]CAF1203461.1 unnamed protein product [Rotaria sordida]CAF3915722.1 unnamed protein product [Rotaria sordida]CAF4091170.1 unnamed protein product [Rotaria sordida]
MEDIPTSDAFDHTELTDIIHNNHQIRRKVQEATNQFLASQNELLQQLQKETFDKTIKDKFDLLINTFKIRSMNEQVVADKVQLALIGENSSGKTALIHYLLESDSFLPSDVGPVSARIIRLTYEDAANAYLRVYSSLKERHKEPCEEVSLSKYFSKPEPDWDGIRAEIADYVTRPNLDEKEKHSEIFADWARKFVEIRIPSVFLKLGIDLYDTPGLLYSDPRILKQNLHDLVETIVPTVVFTYENSAVTSDTKDCFLALKEALDKNELLDVVQRMFVTFSFENTEDQASIKRYNVTRLMTPLIMIRDILIETDDEDNESDTNNKREWHEIKKILRQKVIRKSRPSKSMGRIDLAQQFLSDIRRGFLDQKAFINELVGQWCEIEKNRLQEKMNQQYQLAEQWLPQREKVYRIANKYVEQFAYCINRHKMNVSIQESADDIFALGQVGMTLYESLKANEEASKVVDDLKCLLGKCMHEDLVLRPSASRVVEILTDLSEKD